MIKKHQVDTGHPKCWAGVELIAVYWENLVLLARPNDSQA